MKGATIQKEAKANTQDKLERGYKGNYYYAHEGSIDNNIDRISL